MIGVKYDEVVARLTVNGIGDMDIDSRKRIADWLTKVANEIRKNGDEYTTKRFTARYYKATKKEKSK